VIDLAPPKLKSIPRGCLETFALRLLILQMWEAERAKAIQQSKPLNPCADALLNRLREYQGIRLSHGTLYNWRRAAARGRGSLIDHRLARQPETPKVIKVETELLVTPGGGYIAESHAFDIADQEAQ
jgi:hypothetical protein